MISCKVAGVLAAEKRLASLTLLSGSLGGWFNMIPPITAKLFRTLPKLATASTAHRRADADLDCHYTDAQKRFDEGRQRAKTGEDGHLAAVFKHRVTAAVAAVRDSSACVVAHGRHDFVAGVSAGETLWRAFKDAGCAVADYHVLHGAHFIQREREIEINGLVNAQVAGGPSTRPRSPRSAAELRLLRRPLLPRVPRRAPRPRLLDGRAPEAPEPPEIPEFLASDANATWAALWNQTDEADELLSAFIFRGAPRAGAAALLATA
ncbi:10-hydroxy-9-(phosphonooxy)octadecanoate phosphatase [Aureococcus anophagefferens]|nr:10-hydroxy-9-(phosphonooxy)octadecanoate phosphatase [Aureococcus anophagefferens]